MRARFLLVAVLVVLGAVAFGAYQLARGTAAPDPTQQAEDALSDDRMKERFRGQLGDFIVSEADATERTCSGPFRPSHDRNTIVASELYSSALGEEAEAALCADGSVVGLYVFGDTVIFRGYFVGELHVPFDAPRDRIELVTVAGRPAIREIPVADGLVSNAQVVVIERFPDGDTPGIELAVTTVNDLTKAIAVAEDIMKESGAE